MFFDYDTLLTDFGFGKRSAERRSPSIFWKFGRLPLLVPDLHLREKTMDRDGSFNHRVRPVIELILRFHDAQHPYTRLTTRFGRETSGLIWRDDGGDHWAVLRNADRREGFQAIGCTFGGNTWMIDPDLRILILGLTIIELRMMKEIIQKWDESVCKIYEMFADFREHLGRMEIFDILFSHVFLAYQNKKDDLVTVKRSVASELFFEFSFDGDDEFERTIREGVDGFRVSAMVLNSADSTIVPVEVMPAFDNLVFRANGDLCFHLSRLGKQFGELLSGETRLEKGFAA